MAATLRIYCLMIATDTLYTEHLFVLITRSNEDTFCKSADANIYNTIYN